MGITIFAAVLLILIIFVYFDERCLLYEETKFQSFKRTVKTQKGYAGDSVHTLKQVEQGNLYIAQKNLVNKMKIFKGP